MLHISNGGHDLTRVRRVLGERWDAVPLHGQLG
jgi:hypothetical protein